MWSCVKLAMRVDVYKGGMEPLVKVLFAVAVLLGALMLVKVAGFLMTSSQAQAIATRTSRSTTDGDDLQQQLAQAKTSAELLKKKNLFVQMAPKEHPVKEVIGILGSEVLINDKWYKAGDRVGDAKIVAIEPTKVKIAWDGQEKEFSPIGSSGAGGPPGVQASASPKHASSGGAPVVVRGARRGAGREDRPGMPADERQQTRERWQNMTPEERQRLREEMQGRFGGRNR